MAQPDKIERRIEEGNIALSGWLDRLDEAHRALRNFAGYNGQPSRFRGMTQWFPPVPKGASISVTPPAGVHLQGGLYFANRDGMREPMPNDPEYTAKEPFVGGISIRACFSDDFLEREGILADLICVQESPDNEPVTFSKNRPNRNFFADAVVIPSELRTQVAIAVVGDSAQPIQQP